VNTWDAKQRRVHHLAPEIHNALPPEYKSEAVRLVRSGVSVGQVAKDLGVNDQTIRNWIKQADLDSGRRRTA